MELHELITDKAECTAKIGDAEINFVYKPGVMTLQYIANIEPSFAGMAQLLLDMLTSWDITKDGEVLEINEENIFSLPLEWVNKLHDEIFDDVRSEKN